MARKPKRLHLPITAAAARRARRPPAVAYSFCGAGRIMASATRALGNVGRAAERAGQQLRRLAQALPPATGGASTVKIWLDGREIGTGTLQDFKIEPVANVLPITIDDVLEANNHLHQVWKSCGLTMEDFSRPFTWTGKIELTDEQRAQLLALRKPVYAPAPWLQLLGWMRARTFIWGRGVSKRYNPRNFKVGE